MRLLSGGVDVFYVDESMDREVFAMTAVAVPFLRLVDREWTFVWEREFARAREWRRELSRVHGIPVRKELKGSKLAAGRGNYARGGRQFDRAVP